MGKLTPRQSQIIRLLVRGASQKQAAKSLGISANTVRVHMVNARDRVGADSIAQMVHIAHDELLTAPK